MGSYISSLAGYCEKNLVTHLDKCFVDMREPEVIQQSHLCTRGPSGETRGHSAKPPLHRWFESLQRERNFFKGVALLQAPMNGWLANSVWMLWGIHSLSRHSLSFMLYEIAGAEA